ncbi:sensor histidine kinase [Ruegeria sp. HKCCD8929]|uniref:sensor histidine kinase n=1 Tax=Ruegeria sp. HKCCD8929 TaxID=2683006 RepID=UPI0014899DBA|nr:sensor histidine kinase [Ruegeria sp. HKCCD8929]
MTRRAHVSGSIRRRLLLQLLGSAALLAAILFVTVLGFVRDVAEESHDSILFASATSIMDSIAVNAGEVSVDLPYAALSMLGNVSDDRVFYRVSRAGEVLTGYSDLPAGEATVRAGQPVFETLDYKGETIRMVTSSRRLSLNGAPTDIEVSVAQTQNGQAAILARLSRSALYLGIGFFVLSSALAIWSAQSSVRPLKSLAQAVSRRGPKDLRPVSRPVPSEMAPLVSSLNTFIDRLGVSLTRSEDFIAEAAHRVRTPLATVRTQAEITLRRVEKEENRGSLREMIRAIDETSRASGQLLDHAMVSFRTDSLERVDIDLAELARELVERLRPVADLKDIDLHFANSGTPRMSGDAILIQNAVRNILDNAIKYSPPERQVHIRVSGDGAQARVSIEDEAGGFGTTDTHALTERFVRGENTQGVVGSGLGLTIAREVAEAHGGTLTIETSKSGAGACVTLCFPSH